MYYHCYQMISHLALQELLELGDKIGYVNTGLREDEITRSIRKVKHPSFGSFRFVTEIEKKCSICQVCLCLLSPQLHDSMAFLRTYLMHSILQEEFESNEEMGKLDCGHCYHVYCIKQWLSQKNTCPVCKTAVTKT